MLTELNGHRVWLTVISAGRPENVKAMSELVGAATWYVPSHQEREYRENGAGNCGLGSDQAVVPVRNRALRDAFLHQAVCVQLDDDMKWAAVASNGKAERMPPRLVIGKMVERLMDSDFYLAGGSPTENAYFTRKQNSTTLFIRSGVIAVKPNDLRFDENLLVKFDYDYTLQHIAKFGGVLRCDDLLFYFQQRTAKGGHSEDWKGSRNEQAIRYLLKKWPGLVKRHPRRQGEVLLNVPRRRREVLT